MSTRKVSVIGAGNVGTAVALRIAEKGLADVVLVDIAEKLAIGKALDISHSASTAGIDCKVVGTSDYSLTVESDIVVITAGIARKLGIEKEDLLQTNSQVVKNCVESFVKYSPKTILIMVTDPLEVMSYVAYKISNFPKNRVVGITGIVDSARIKLLLAKKLNISSKKINIPLIGGSGKDSVPLLSYATVMDKPIYSFLSKKEVEEIVKKAKQLDEEILNFFQTSSPCYAPASAVYQIAEAVIHDRKKNLLCSAFLNGEYKQNDIFAGVLGEIGSNGVEKIVEFELSKEETVQFQNSLDHIREMINLLNL